MDLTELQHREPCEEERQKDSISEDGGGKRVDLK